MDMEYARRLWEALKGVRIRFYRKGDQYRDALLYEAKAVNEWLTDNNRNNEELKILMSMIQKATDPDRPTLFPM